MYWYSICTRSGAPEPAFSAVRSLVYSAVPWPAFTTLILMAGYFFSKTAISLLMSGTQVQNVNVVGVCMALSMSAWLTAAVDVEPEPEPPQAARNRLPRTLPDATDSTRLRL